MEQTNQQKMEWTQQMQAYVAWVNSQLKKRLDTKPVNDLSKDLSDGTVLVQLLEIISGENVENINKTPNSTTEKLSNITSILQFMKDHNIQMHKITEQDIIEGNMKSMMRLILALAAYFKPASVATSKAVNAVAVNAAAVMGDLRKQVTASGRSRHRWKSGSPMSSGRRIVGSHQVYRAESDHTMNYSLSASPTLAQSHSRVTSETSSYSPLSSPRQHRLLFSPSGESVTPIKDKSHGDAESVTDMVFLDNSVNYNDQLLEEHEILEQEINSTKQLVGVLQNLLLNGVVPEQYEAEDAESSDPIDGENMQEQILVLNGRIDQLRIENEQLKKSCGKVKEDLRSAAAGKSALQSRLQQNEVEMMDAKQQLLRVQLNSDQIKNENANIYDQLEDQKQLNERLHQKLVAKEARLDELQKKLSKSLNSLQQQNLNMKVLSKKDDQIQHLEKKVQELSFRLPSKMQQSHCSFFSDEEKIVAESLQTLRLNLPPKDHTQHVVDTLEQAFLSIMQSLQQSSPRLTSTFHALSPSANHSRNNNRHQASPQYCRKSHSQPQDDRSNTMIIYFTDKMMTPNRITINKKIGEITLHDFKSRLNLRGKPRFNFKAQDPEYGTVKQEVCNDGDVLPGWEGKIVSWIDM